MDLKRYAPVTFDRRLGFLIVKRASGRAGDHQALRICAFTER